MYLENLKTRERLGSISLTEDELIFKDRDPYKNGLQELVVYYAGLENIQEMILTMQSVRSVVDGFYQVLTNYRHLKEIGTLPESERRRIWKLTERLEKNERVKASRAIYLMDQILKK